MPFGNILGSVATGLVGSLFGADDATTNSSHVSGDGVDPNTGFLKRVNKGLDTPLGNAGLRAAGGVFDDFRQRRQTEKQFDFLRSKGLTPVEIAGGGGAGGVANTSGNTLGSGPAQQLGAQQAFQAQERQKDRAHEERLHARDLKHKENMLGLESDKFKYVGRPVGEMTERKLASEVDINAEQLKLLEIQVRDFYPILFSKMSAPNVMASLFAALHGLPLEDVLKGKSMSPGQRQGAESFIRDVRRGESPAAKAFDSAVDLLVRLIEGDNTVALGERSPKDDSLPKVQNNKVVTKNTARLRKAEEAYKRQRGMIK